MKKQISFLFMLLAFLSCVQKQETSIEAITVEVEDFQDKELEMNDFISDASTILLYADSLGYIGQIKDMCVVDSFLYVLDGVTASLTQFYAESGKQKSTICRRGNGPFEYIQPVTLTSDGQYLYLLDLPGMSIIAFDAALQGVKEVSLAFPCMDFVKTDDGFLCYNAAPTEDLGRIVYVDNEGEIGDSFLPGNGGMPYSPGTKVFVKNSRDEIFINPPFSRTVYRWNCSKKQPEEYLVFDFGGKNIPADADLNRMNVFEEPYVVPSTFFQMGDTSLYSFLYAQKRYYAVVSSEGIQVGLVPEDSERPFFPQWQVGDKLAGTYSAPFPGTTEDNGGEVISLFLLK